MMKTIKASLTILLAVFVLAAAEASAQSAEKFSDPSVEYSFELPDAKWKQTVKPSEANPSVEYVFVDRNDGHLAVRKTTAAQSALMTDIIREEEQKLRFMRGFVAGKEERFAGKLDGSVFNFEFVERGRPKSGRFYFLRSGTTVYILRFTGYTDKLRSVQHHADSIARTFSVKKG